MAPQSKRPQKKKLGPLITLCYLAGPPYSLASQKTTEIWGSVNENTSRS